MKLYMIVDENEHNLANLYLSRVEAHGDSGWQLFGFDGKFQGICWKPSRIVLAPGEEEDDSQAVALPALPVVLQ